MDEVQALDEAEVVEALDHLLEVVAQVVVDQEAEVLLQAEDLVVVDEDLQGKLVFYHLFDAMLIFCLNIVKPRWS